MRPITRPIRRLLPRPLGRPCCPTCGKRCTRDEAEAYAPAYVAEMGPDGLKVWQQGGRQAWLLPWREAVNTAIYRGQRVERATKKKKAP